MSKLLKSKFLLGVMTLAIMFVGVVANVSGNTASADCSITTTLRVGSKGAEVACLQAAVGVTADGSFGPKTKAAVVAWQKSVGLVADGVFGPKSRAAWMASVTVTYPSGCTSASGYSSTTGLACYAIPVGSSLPAGCTSTNGYSSTTGASCAGTGNPVYPAGCTSSAGFSPTTGASCATGAVNNQTGPVGVSLSSDNPAAGYIIANQATADLLHVTFTGSGTINSVVLQRTGISDQNTLSNVYLYDGAVRLTDGFSFNNVGQLTMNGLGIAVNGSKTISVKADVADVSNASSLGVSLIGFTAAGQTATTVSVKGNEMSYGTGNLATVVLNSANQTITGARTVNAGTSAYTVWSNSLQVNTRAVWLKGANFRMVGSAPADALQNIRLYVDGVQVGSAATMGSITGSNYAMFDFAASPVSLSTGSHTLDVRADVVKGASYTVTVSLQQAADLVLYDAQLGVNIAVVQATGTPNTAYSTSSSGVITIAPGTASVNVDPTFSAMTNVTSGATNVVIGKFKVHGYGEDVKVSSLSVTPTLTSTTPAAAGLSNVSVYFNGSQVGSSVNWTSGAITFNLGSQMIIPAGTDSYIEVRSDIQTTGSVAYTAGSVSVTLNTGSGNGQGQSSHTSINFPSSPVVGTTLTIQAGTLAVSKNTGYASQNVNPNTAGVKIGSYILQNQSTSESVRVTSLAVNLKAADGTTDLTVDNVPTGAPALTNFSNLRTSETSGSGSTPVQPSAANTFSVDFTIAPGTTKVVDIFADTSSAASRSFTTTLKVTSLGANSNVSISQNGNGTAVVGQVITLAVGVLDNTISLLAAPSTSQQFVPAANGSTNATKATFKLTSTGGAATISEMKFTVNSQDVSVAATGTNAVGTQTITPTTGSDADKFKVGDSVQLLGATGATGIGTVGAITAGTSLSVNITVVAGSAIATVRAVPATVTGVTVNGTTASPVNGVAYLTGLNLTVPNGGSGLSQDVYVSYAPVGTNGIATGSTSRVALEYVKYQSGNTTSTLCTAAIQACTTVQTPGTVTAPTMKLVGSAPSLSLAASSSTLVVGSIDVGSVIVSANAKGDLTINDLPISVTLSNATLTADANGGGDGTVNDIVVKDSNGNTVVTTNTVFSGTTTGGTSTISFTGGYQIPAGTSQTFHIFLNFAAVTASTGSATLGLGTADLFSWTDTAGNASALTGLDVAGSAVTTRSNRYKSGSAGTVTPGYFYNYPSNTVNVNNFN